MLPAIEEELMFRGGIQRSFTKMFRIRMSLYGFLHLFLAQYIFSFWIFPRFLEQRLVISIGGRVVYGMRCWRTFKQCLCSYVAWYLKHNILFN
ncbi:hypothetical protein CS542_00010 [Pedobacter sp. IW39]|nr:hypothetical protein CS542_00010 [Pedobacter sp. IW39]